MTKISSKVIRVFAGAGLGVVLWAQPARSGCPAVIGDGRESQSSAGPTAQAEASGKKPLKNDKSHQYDFLLIGTVFTENGFSLEGAQLRIRRAGDKKFRWETLTDRRGEFAVRVKQGADYEIVVRAKGFQEQTRTVDAKSGDREDLNFHLAPAPEGKPK